MSVKVTLHGDGLNYETEASLIQAAKIIGFLNTEEALQNDYVSVQSTASNQNNFLAENTTRQTSSPREAIIEASAKTNAQKITVLGLYITTRDGSDEFNSSELKSLFLKAGEPAPRNLARDMRDAVRSGYIAESFDKSDSYIITNTGVSAVSNGFEAAAQSVTRKRRTPSNSTKTQPIPEWLKDLSVNDQLDSFPSYRKMKTRSEKVLWILQWAKENSKDRLSGIEIIHIASKLSDNIPSKQIAAALSPYLSKSYVSKNSEGYAILYNGTEYLKSIEA